MPTRRQEGPMSAPLLQRESTAFRVMGIASAGGQMHPSPGGHPQESTPSSAPTVASYCTGPWLR